jgi:hypothetical protein
MKKMKLGIFMSGKETFIIDPKFNFKVTHFWLETVYNRLDLTTKKLMTFL